MDKKFQKFPVAFTHSLLSNFVKPQLKIGHGLVISSQGECVSHYKSTLYYQSNRGNKRGRGPFYLRALFYKNTVIDLHRHFIIKNTTLYYSPDI